MFQAFGDFFELGNDGRVAFVARLAIGVGRRRHGPAKAVVVSRILGDHDASNEED